MLARFYLAEALRHLGETERAQSYYRQVLPISRQYVDVANRQHYSLAVSLIYSADVRSGGELDQEPFVEAIKLMDDALGLAMAFQYPCWNRSYIWSRASPSIRSASTRKRFIH